MQSIYANPGVHLALGRKGENVARQVIDAFSAGDVRILQTINGAEVVMTALSLKHHSGSGSGPIASLLVVDPTSNAVKALNLVG